MSLDYEDRSLPQKQDETFSDLRKHSKISYTRDFLLSLSELEICKKLPSDFDRSILSEFEDASLGLQDKQRIGSSPLQSFRRAEYGSSPPTKGDSSNYSRGIYGRWDNRSSGRDDKESDSQSDWNSESGRRYGNQSRRPWQSAEHDGLLGSGSFPRSSGYAPGTSVPKVGASDQLQLNKTSEPYHPPRPFKAVPHTRRATHDTFNDETFGPSECSSEDRAEEERKRRASFELMRKEQHKVMQEKQKLSSDKHNNDSVSDIDGLLENAKDDKKPLDKSNEINNSLILDGSNKDLGKLSFPSQTNGSRPLVPPGFASTVLERNPGTKSSTHTHLPEIGISETEVTIPHPKANSAQNGSLRSEERQSGQEMDLCGKQLKDISIRAKLFDKGEKVVHLSTSLEMSNDKDVNDQLYRTSSLSESHDTLDSGEINLASEEMRVHKIIGNLNQDNSTSILQKLFGSASTENTGGSSGLVESRNSKPEHIWSPHTAESSKFAQWFVEEERKSGDELVSSASDLLSLIVGGEKAGSQVADVQAPLHLNSSHIPFQGSVHKNRHEISDIKSAPIGISDKLSIPDKQEAVPTILTCEDLEQTILSEVRESSSTSRQTVQGWSVAGAKMEQPKPVVDDRASQHLLSLLQKGPGAMKDLTITPDLGIELSGKLHVSEVANIRNAADSSMELNSRNSKDTDKNLTLETLFGSAFMKELQSVEAPVSLHRGGSVGSARIDIPVPHEPFRIMDDSLLTSQAEVESSRMNNDYALASNHGQQSKLDKFEKLLGYNNPQREVDSSPSELGSKLGGFDGTVETLLPQEESLISVGGPVNIPSSMFMSTETLMRGGSLNSKTPIETVDKLTALHALFKNEQSMVGQESQPYMVGPLSMHHTELPYHNLHAQQSPQFHAPQMSHGRPSYHTFDSHPVHLNSQMKFISPESNMRNDAPPNHQFPAHRPPFHRPNTVVTDFNLPGHNPLLQQAQMRGNFPSPHLLHEFSRGAPLPGANARPTGFMHELDPMQGFHNVHHQPNFGGLGMPVSAPDNSRGSNHPEAFQRLIEMELRAKSKQIHPFANVGRGQGMRGNELDMAFNYR